MFFFHITYYYLGLYSKFKYNNFLTLHITISSWDYLLTLHITILALDCLLPLHISICSWDYFHSLLSLGTICPFYVWYLLFELFSYCSFNYFQWIVAFKTIFTLYTENSLLLGIFPHLIYNYLLFGTICLFYLLWAT